MSWLFSQALVAEYSAGNCLDGEPSAQWSGIPTAQVYSPSGKTMAFSKLLRYGMTCKPLTESHGEALLTWFLAGFPVKTYPQLAPEPALTENAQECGEKWPASWVKYDPDSSGWKTAQFSLLEDSTVFSGTWPEWGLMLDGECWAVDMLDSTPSGGESGYWPTPNCGGFRSDGELLMLSRKLKSYADYRGMTDRACKSKRDRFWPEPEGFRPTSEKLNPEFQEWLMAWPIGQTGLKPLGMDKYQLWRQQHGNFSEARHD